VTRVPCRKPDCYTRNLPYQVDGQDLPGMAAHGQQCLTWFKFPATVQAENKLGGPTGNQGRDLGVLLATLPGSNTTDSGDYCLPEHHILPLPILSIPGPVRHHASRVAGVRPAVMVAFRSTNCSEISKLSRLLFSLVWDLGQCITTAREHKTSSRVPENCLDSGSSETKVSRHCLLTPATTTSFL
jgi:hypothetical protein